MLKIGLTGGIASGKSTVSQFFSELNVTVIDADKIARDLVQQDQPCYTKIVETFGNTILLNNGELNRKKLRQLVFSELQAKKKLEYILHPEVRKQLLSRSNLASSPYCILSIPLLIESDMMDIVDRILVIDIEPEQQLNRLCQRDSISPADARLIINSQCTREQRLDLADDIIYNNDSLDKIKICVNNLHQKYIALAKSSL